jgi:hypothetical protein
MSPERYPSASPKLEDDILEEDEDDIDEYDEEESSARDKDFD